MHSELNEFIQYCAAHGSFLKNRKEFGEMAGELMAAAIRLELGQSGDVVKKSIILPERRSEWLVAIPPEGYGRVAEGPANTMKVGMLVYAYDCQISEREFVYKFAGFRLA